MAELIGGAAGSLRNLAVMLWSPMPPAVVAEVRRCRGLRRLHCDVADVAVLSGLPSLSSLTLWMDSLVALPGDAAAVHADWLQSAFLSAAATLRPCSLASLRGLRLVLTSLPSRMRRTRWQRDMKAGVVRLLQAVATAAPGLSALTIDNSDGDTCKQPGHSLKKN